MLHDLSHLMALFGGVSGDLEHAKQWLLDFVGRVGLPAIFIVMGLESMGLPLPGETILLFAGVLAEQGRFDVLAVIAVGVTATIVGDNAGYWVGRRGGRPLIDKHGHRVHLSARRMDRAEHFFEHRGGPAVAAARFIPGLRVIGALAAGTSHMRWRTFLIWNCIGGVTWVTMVVLVGYVLGPAYKQAEKYFGIGGAIVIAIAVAVAAAVYFIRQHHEVEELDETWVDPDDAPHDAAR